MFAKSNTVNKLRKVGNPDDNLKRRNQNRKNYVENLKPEDMARILKHPFIRGVFTEEANKRRKQHFIQNLGKKMEKFIHS